EDLVADLQRGVAAGDDDAVAAQHGHDGRVAGEVELDDLVAGRRAVGGEGDLDERRPPALERQQADERADADRLLDERGEQVGGGHGDVDAQLSSNSHWFFGLFTRATTR